MTSLLGDIDLAAFFAAVASPAEMTDAIDRAEALAETASPVFRPTYEALRDARLVDEFWEGTAPARWIDRREGSPTLFLGRSRPPRRRTSSTTPFGWFPVYDTPTSLELAAQLAADPTGVETCEALGREAITRMGVWVGPERAPKSVAWCLLDPWWREDGYVFSDRGELDESAFAGYRSLDRREQDWQAWEAWLRSSDGQLLSDTAATEGGRRWGRRPKAPTYEKALSGALDFARAWVALRFAAARGLSERAGSTGRPLTEMPDAMDPLMMILGLGYAPVWCNGEYLVIAAPWTRRSSPLSAGTWPEFWQS